MVSIELCSPYDYEEFAGLSDGRQVAKVIADHGLARVQADAYAKFGQPPVGEPRQHRGHQACGPVRMGAGATSAHVGHVVERLEESGDVAVGSIMEEAVSAKVDETLAEARELEPTFGRDPIPVTDHEEHLVGGLSLPAA